MLIVIQKRIAEFFIVNVDIYRYRRPVDASVLPACSGIDHTRRKITIYHVIPVASICPFSFITFFCEKGSDTTQLLAAGLYQPLIDYCIFGDIMKYDFPANQNEVLRNLLELQTIEEIGISV